MDNDDQITHFASSKATGPLREDPNASSVRVEVSNPAVIAPDVGATPMVDEPFITMGEEAPVEAQKATHSSGTPLQDSLRRLRRDKRAMVSLAVIILFVVVPLIGPILYQHIGGFYQSPTSGPIGPDTYHNPFHQELARQDEGPSAQFWLGTDSIGRDMFARLMQGMLVSLFVALAVEVMNILLGISVGVLAGYYGGWLDQFLARFTDVMFAFPGLLFAILLTGILGAQADVVFNKLPLVGANGNARLLLVSMALAMTTWPLMARYVRGQTLQLKQQQFVEAARTAGSSNTTIILRHIIPNLFSIVVVASTLNMAGTIIGEASLSFLGLGVQPPGSSIGLMINDALGVADTKPWQVLFPAIVLALIVVAFSFLGDGLRDAFDPRSKD